MADKSWAQTKHQLGLWTAALLRDMFGEKADGRFGILMYHRFAEHRGGGAQPTWNVTPARFREQLEGLLNRGFTAISLAQAIEMAARRQRMPAKTFVVTIDDGYECVYTQAWPILRELKIPATVFLATAYLGTNEPFPCDDWSCKGSHSVAAEGWRPMSLEQCREMHSEGTIALGAHTHTHQDFRNRVAEFAADLGKNVYFLRDAFGIERPPFAFPYGTKSTGFAGGALTEAARAAGVSCALNTESVMADVARDPFDWGRFEAESDDTAATLAGKLTGWFSTLHKFTRVMESPDVPAQP